MRLSKAELIEAVIEWCNNRSIPVDGTHEITFVVDNALKTAYASIPDVIMPVQKDGPYR